MPIEFRCAGCQKLLRTDDHTGGLTAKCPECGTFQQIPDLGSPLNLWDSNPSLIRKSAAASKPRRPIECRDEPRGNDAVVSIILGSTAVCLGCCFPLAFPTALIGILMGARALFSGQRPILASIGIIISLLALAGTLAATFRILMSL